MPTQRRKVCAALIMGCLPLVSMAEAVPYIAQQAIPTAPCTGNVCYDTQGDLVRDNTLNQYTYNGLSQLTTTTPKATNQAITYTYFPNGQLANVSNGTTNITHYYTRNNQVFDSVANNGNHASYLIANGITSRNATISNTLTTTAYIQNLKGSVVETVSPTKTTSSQYDAYGADIDSTAAIVKPLSIANNPIRYDGYFYEWGSGLYNLGNARDYNVRLRTFMTADSVLIHSDNMYFYGNNDPIDMSDPSGHNAVVDFFGSLFLPFYNNWHNHQKINAGSIIISMFAGAADLGIIASAGALMSGVAGLAEGAAATQELVTEEDINTASTAGELQATKNMGKYATLRQQAVTNATSRINGLGDEPIGDLNYNDANGQDWDNMAGKRYAYGKDGSISIQDEFPRKKWAQNLDAVGTKIKQIASAPGELAMRRSSTLAGYLDTSLAQAWHDGTFGRALLIKGASVLLGTTAIAAAGASIGYGVTRIIHALNKSAQTGSSGGTGFNPSVNPYAPAGGLVPFNAGGTWPGAKFQPFKFRPWRPYLRPKFVPLPTPPA